MCKSKLYSVIRVSKSVIKWSCAKKTSSELLNASRWNIKIEPIKKSRMWIVDVGNNLICSTMVEGTPEGRAFDCVINYASEASNTPSLVAKIYELRNKSGRRMIQQILLKCEFYKTNRRLRCHLCVDWAWTSRLNRVIN